MGRARLRHVLLARALDAVGGGRPLRRLVGVLALITGGVLVGCDGPEAADPAPGGGELTHVELRTVIELDLGDAPTLPSPGGLVALDPTSGRAALVDRQVPYEILLFSDNGALTARLGQAGDGPGEFDRIQVLAFDGAGALWVVSRGGSRADVFGPGLELDRTLTLEAPVLGLAPLGGGAFVAVVQGPGGPELVRLGPDGGSESLAAPWGPGAEAPLVAVTTDGEERFWATAPHAFRIFSGSAAAGDPFDVELDELALAEPDWFAEAYPAAFQDEFQTMLDTRGATILGLRQEADTGLLWLTAGVPSSSAEAAAVRAAFEGGDPERLEALPAMLIDHVVMALDAETGAPVAEGRFDFLNLPPSGDPPYEIRDGTVVRVLRPYAVRPYVPR